MSFELGFFGLLIFCFIREAFFMYSTQKLVNKVMCKSFYDYKQAERVGQVDRPQGLAVDDGMEEDLGVLTGIV